SEPPPHPSTPALRAECAAGPSAARSARHGGGIARGQRRTPRVARASTAKRDPRARSPTGEHAGSYRLALRRESNTNASSLLEPRPESLQLRLQQPRQQHRPDRIRHGQRRRGHVRAVPSPSDDDDGSARKRARLRYGTAERRHDPDRKSTRLNSSHVKISYAVFCLKKKKEREKLYRRCHDKN